MKTPVKQPEIRTRTAPDALLKAIGEHGIPHLFHAIELHSGKWVGVVGDGDNGWYETFVWFQGRLTLSRVGWGTTEWALKDILLKESE